MRQDRFVRFFLVLIAGLLAIIAFRNNPPATALAAEPPEYLLTDNKGTPYRNQPFTKLMDDMRMKGWKFQTFTSGGLLLWYK